MPVCRSQPVDRHNSIVYKQIDNNLNSAKTKGKQTRFYERKSDSANVSYIDPKFSTIMTRNTVSVSINNTKTSALCDTGASISCLSESFFNKAFLDKKPKISESKIKTIVGVGGTHHAVSGEVNLDISFGTVTLASKFYVIKDLHHSVILGIDFMEKHKVSLDIASKKFIIHDFLKVCSLSTNTGYARTVRSTKILPQAEVNIPVKISRVRTGSNVLLEPLVSLTHKHILGAKCLVHVENGKAALRVVNPTNKIVYLKSNKILATVSEVEKKSVFSIGDVDKHSFENEQSLGISDIKTNSKPSSTLDFNLKDSDLNDYQKKQLLDLLNKNRDIFSEGLHDLGCTHLQTHKIETGDAMPVKLPAYKQNPVVREATRVWVQKMLENKIIDASSSNWHSPVVLVKKAGSDEYRFAVDYRKLNKISKPQAYPLPRLSDIFDAIGESNSQFFSSLDLGKAFWQVPLEQDSREKASFICAEGIFSFRKMPFGLSGAPATFQSLLMKVLSGISWKFVLCYVDDVIIFSATFKEHLSHLNEVFSRMRQAGLKLSPGKCYFAQKKLHYLGHVISKEGIQADPRKIEKVQNLCAPTNQKGVKSLLGLTNYYKKFIKGYSKICAPLFQLLQKNSKFEWTDDCQKSLDTLKNALCSAPILAFPDMNKPFILTCDASRSGLGYILGQLDSNGKERVIEYSGRALQAAEKNYTVSEIECLAIVSGVKAFRAYLSTDIPFTIITDHQALKVLNSITTSQNGRIARWALFLQGFKYTVHYRKGELNNADALSRLVPDTSDKQQISLVTISNDAEKDSSVTDEPSGVDVGTYRHTEKEVRTVLKHTNILDSKYLETTFEYTGSSSVLEIQTDTETKDESPDDTGKLILMQKNCPDFVNIYKYLSEGELPKDEKLMRKTMYDKEFYEIVDDVLIHKYQNRGKKKPTEDKFIIQTALPKKLRVKVMQEYHDHNGHFGVKKTFTEIQNKYYWPHMYQEILDFVKSCDICQRAKHTTHQVSTPLNPLPVVNVFERMHLDIIGPLHKTTDGFEYILVCVDSFSRWVEAFALTNQSAAEIARVLHNEIFCRYGAPVSIVTDRGQNFLSKLINAVCEIYNVTRHRTASYNPKANGCCERQNATIIQTLRMYIDKDQKNWNMFLPIVLQALRSSPNIETSGFSPYKMMFGGEMRLPMDVNLIPRETLGTEAKQHIQSLLQRLKVIHNIAKQNTETTQQESKVRHDLKAQPSDFRLLEQVLLKINKHTPGLTSKLEYKWKGPYYIRQKVSPDTYRIAESNTHQLHRAPVNAKDLKRYNDPDNFRFQSDDEQIIDAQSSSTDHNDQLNNPDQGNVTNNNDIENNQDDQTQTPRNQVSDQNKQLNVSREKSPTPTTSNNNDGVWYKANRILKLRIRNGMKEYLIEWSNKKYKPTWQTDENVSEELKRLFYVRYTKSGKKRKRQYRYFNT